MLLARVQKENENDNKSQITYANIIVTAQMKNTLQIIKP